MEGFLAAIGLIEEGPVDDPEQLNDQMETLISPN